ncbi:MAG: SAM-dependent methyltransferase [bacterium]|nr:SAM-dependent methyltransferase [bacterium]MDT8365939.1 SAM-dependent methyltransferase [bacterium]
MTLNNKKPHPIYFIGAGPGDAKYLTLEGSEALARCSLVYAVDPYPETFARLLSGMTVSDPLERVFEELIQEIDEASRSAPVGFLVPGDITVFSPFLPIVEHFAERSKVIAGVGTLNAAAALIKQTLDMPGVSHSVVLTSPKHIDKAGDAMDLGRLARAAGTMVLYMNNRPLEQLAEELSGGFAPETPAAILSRVGMEGEKVYRCTVSTMAEVVGEDDIFGLVSGDPSLAIIIVGDVLTAKSDPTFWNKRKEKFWNKKKGGRGDTGTR